MREVKIPTTNPINTPIMAKDNLNIPVDTSMINTTKNIKMKKDIYANAFGDGYQHILENPVFFSFIPLLIQSDILYYL